MHASESVDSGLDHKPWLKTDRVTVMGLRIPRFCQAGVHGLVEFQTASRLKRCASECLRFAAPTANYEFLKYLPSYQSAALAGE